MEPNIIYCSDASYDPKTKEAGLGIKNLTTGVSHSVALRASSVQEAEEFALLEAINHAILHRHRNCIFVYDNINIDTASIGAFYAKAFEMIQFLWCKRDYLIEVDRLAANVRSSTLQTTTLSKQILSLANQISDEELVCALMPLTRGETYGYLCAISATAPMHKSYPSSMKEVNEKIISLLMYVASKRLRGALIERFGYIRGYKEKHYDELLKSAHFSMEWFEEAKYECRALYSAA